jgi:hypothetical protein
MERKRICSRGPDRDCLRYSIRYQPASIRLGSPAGKGCSPHRRLGRPTCRQAPQQRLPAELPAVESVRHTHPGIRECLSRAGERRRDEDMARWIDHVRGEARPGSRRR